MAGIGDAWGTREELLHPRDKHGRFKSKWKMAAGVVDKIIAFLSAFRPRTFQSDGQAAQYNQNLGNKKRFSTSDLARLHADYNPAQEDLRDGVIDEPSTKKFVAMMDSHAIELPDDVIVSRVVGPDAFGLTAANMDADDGGITDFTGKKIADRGYSATNLGTPLGGGSGQITMSIAVPKGTKATFTGQGGNDRAMYLQRHQELRVTKVTPDGRGGYYMLAVAEGTGTDTPEPLGGHVGAGRPGNREQAVRDVQTGQSKRMGGEGDTTPTPAPGVGDGGAPVQDNNAVPAPQQTLPDGTQPRNEPVHAESIGGGPAAPASPAPSPQTAEAPAAPAGPPPAAGPPLEDADVAKLRQRRDARSRYQAIADRVPLGNAGAEMHELVGKKASNKVIGEHIRAYATGPAMAEVHKDQKERVRHELERVAEAFEQDKPTLGKQRMATHLKQNSITLQHDDKVGKNVDFDEATMESTGDIPENGQVEVIKPAVLAEGVVLEKAVVSAATKKTRKPTQKKVQQPGAPSKLQDKILERAAKVEGTPKPGSFEDTIVQQAKQITKDREGFRAPKKVAPKKVSASGLKPETEDAIVARMMQRVDDNKINREEFFKGTSAADRKLVEDAEARHKARTAGVPAPKKALSPAEKRIAAGEKAAAPAPKEITDKTTVADLRKIAAERGVDLKGARLKADIRARIEGGPSATPVKKAAAPKRLRDVQTGDVVIWQGTQSDDQPLLGRVAREPGKGVMVDWSGGRREHITSVGLKNETNVRVATPEEAQRLGPSVVPAKKAAAGRSTAAPGEIPDKATVADLRKIAAERGVDLKGARLKADIRKRIEGGEAPTPAAKKTAAAAVPGEITDKERQAAAHAGLPPYKAPGPTAPSTAKGKIGQARLQAGNRILVNPDGTPARVKTGAVEVSVTGRNSNGSLKAVDASGKEYEVGKGLPGYQTYFLGKDPDVATTPAAPAKKTVKTEDLTGAGGLSDDPAVRSIQVENRIRAAHVQVSTSNGRSYHTDSVSGLEDIRAIVGPDVSQQEFDQELRRMVRERTATINPESNQKTLNPQRRAAAIRFGDQDKHLLSLRDPKPRPRPLPTTPTAPPVEAVPATPTRIPDAPRGASTLDSKERKDAFERGWIDADIKAPLGPENSALNETFLGLRSGKLTPEEGVTQIEDSIKLTQAKIDDLADKLRSPMPPLERKAARERKDALHEGRVAQEKASKFLRKYFSDEAPVTPSEIKLHLDPVADKELLDATPDDIREAAKLGGFGKLKGETKDEVVTDLARKMIAKKAIPTKKIAPEPAKVTTFSEPGKVDAKTVGTGIPFTDGDTKMLAHVQDMLDGTGGEKKATPAAVGKYLDDWAKGGAGPFYRAAVHRAAQDKKPDQNLPRDSKTMAEADRLTEQGNRWKELAARLKATKRPAAPKAPANPEAAKLHDRIASKALEDLAAAKSVDSGHAVLKGLTAPELVAIAKSLGMDTGARPNKEQLSNRIVQRAVGRRLDEAAITGRPTVQVAPAAPTKAGPRVRTLSDVTDGSGRIVKRDRPNADEPIHLPNGGSDQGLVHLDSEVGKLWADLYADDRQPNSFLNEIAKMGDALGRDKIEVSEIVDRLKAMKGRSADSGVADRIQDAIDGLDAPEVKLPEFSPDVPPVVRKYFEDLAKIPTARKTGRVANTTFKVSMLDRKLEVLKKMESGQMSPREARDSMRQLEQMSRDSVHESVDGAFKMWALEQDAFGDKNRVELRDWLTKLTSRPKADGGQG